MSRVATAKTMELIGRDRDTRSHRRVSPDIHFLILCFCAARNEDRPFASLSRSRRETPINHGPCNTAMLRQRTVGVCTVHIDGAGYPMRV